MQLDELKSWIIKQAHCIGIDEIGFTTADNFEYLRASLSSQIQLKNNSGFEHQNLDERLNPDLLLKNAKSIISIALAYPSALCKNETSTLSKVARGQIARSSWGNDYHRILKMRMNTLIERIREKVESEYKFLPMVDTGELIDVAVAERAGIGFVGKNGLLITKKYGSFVYLGEIITDIPFAPDVPLENLCGDCEKCLKACPTKALLGAGVMNAKRCLSFQTQSKGILDEEYKRKMRNVIYGCDICQLVCPFNRDINSRVHEEMRPIVSDVLPDLHEFITLSNKQFKLRFGYMAFSWRGKNPLQRNAIYALGNLKSKEALPILKHLSSTDTRDEIVDACNWAINEIIK